jgi:anti-sigma regulatory factor (Ser/Thr protein kinase)
VVGAVSSHSRDLFVPESWRGEIGLAGNPTSAREARAFVRMALENSVSADTLEDLLLLASEMVSNVIRHARTPLTLCIETYKTFVRLTVTDGALPFDAPTVRADDAESGRGMGIIASISRSWGIGLTPIGKSIWAEVDTA